jgi:hypothetical protein
MKIPWLSRLLAALLPTVLLLAACESSAPDSCTTVFLTVTTTVVDTLGTPVPDATLTSTLVRTGEQLAPTSLALLTAGTYIVVDDGSRKKLRASGDNVAVTVQRGTGPVTSATFRIDVPGGCHVHKLSGPDSLIVSLLAPPGSPRSG